jgi:hypothetical protein
MAASWAAPHYGLSTWAATTCAATDGMAVSDDGSIICWHVCYSHLVGRILGMQSQVCAVELRCQAKQGKLMIANNKVRTTQTLIC